MSSPLHRLASALAGRGPIEPGAERQPLPSPPEALKVFPATPVPPTPVEAPPAPPSAVPAHTRLLTHAGRTQSIRAWASTLGIDRCTLAYRVNHGWSVEQALGVAPRPRDHAAEQAASTERLSRVLVVDHNGHTVPRREAAQRLGIKPQSLTHRLRQYRPADGSNTKIPLTLLEKK